MNKRFPTMNDIKQAIDKAMTDYAKAAIVNANAPSEANQDKEDTAKGKLSKLKELLMDANL